MNPHATTPPATAAHPLLLARLNTACLSVAKSNYFWITDGVSRSIAPIAATMLLIRPAVGSAENRGGGYLNRWGLLLVLTDLAFVRWGKMTTPYRLQDVLRCREMVFLFRCHVLAPCWEANALHRPWEKTKQQLTDFLPKILISPANDADFKLLLPCVENKYVMKVI